MSTSTPRSPLALASGVVITQTFAKKMEITLRPLSQDDVKSLEAWTARERVAPYMSRWTPRTASGWHCSRDLCRWHVIVVDDRSVGTIWIEREHADERVADLGILIGEPDDRGNGFGTTAIRIAERDAVESWGIGQVRLRVRVSNPAAIRCYERSGFLPVNKTTKEVDGVVFEVVHMVHDLGSLRMAEGEQVVPPNGPSAKSSHSILHPITPVGGLKRWAKIYIMKIHCLLGALFVLIAAASAEEIPARDPKPKEWRPGWWLECWQEQVVVVEGIISYVDDNTPDVTVVLHDDAVAVLDDEDKEVQKTFSHYYIGTVEAKNLLFAAPGSERSDLRLDRLAHGEECTLRVLVPAVIAHRAPGKIAHKDKVVIVLRYDIMGGPFPYVARATIQQDDMKSAMNLFEHRKKFDHRKPQK